MRPGTLLRWHALKPLFNSDIKDGSLVLDIGGYDGFISDRLRAFKDVSVSVVDLDKEGLAAAETKELKTIHCSAFNLPIQDESIDVVLALDLIEHIEDDEGLLMELSRVTRKDGRLILTTPMENGVTFPFLSEVEIERINKYWGHIHKGYSLERIEKLFENSQWLIIEKSKYFNFLTRLVYRFCFLSKLPVKGKNLLYKLIVRLEPFIKFGAQEHIIMAEKSKSNQ
jgi:SAM-dependent methyltransferase